MRYPPRAIRIPRPRGSSYSEPIAAWLYFDGPISALKEHTKLVLDVPGGGFVAMTPRNHDDKLLAWAGRLSVPVLSLEYKKAPEHPYPYALNECYDTYLTLIASKGRCVGFSGETEPRIVVSGDSAGGNLAVGMTLMILQAGSTDSRRFQGEQVLPPPEGVILIYPALDMNIGNWMTDEQMALIRDRRVRKTNENILRRKSDDYRKLTPDTPHVSDDEDEEGATPTVLPLSSKDAKSPVSPTATTGLTKSPSTAIHLSAAHTGKDNAAILKVMQTAKPQQFKTRLAMSSMISYFNDRILTPEMMRAMIILYIGPHNRPDFGTDFLLSPLLAPEALLAQFPKTYFLTGERDPLVDDTVIFAGRIRQAKQARLLERKELGLERERTVFWEHEHVEVVLIPGISHGFLQFVSLFPEGWKYIFKCSRWMRDIFDRVDGEDGISSAMTDRGDYFANGFSVTTTAENTPATTPGGPRERIRHHFRTRAESSGEEDRPLEMTLKGLTSSANSSNGKRGRGGNGSPSATRGPLTVNTRAAATTGAISRSSVNMGKVRGVAKRPGMQSRQKSLVSLASSEDLLGRRMKGLTGSLMGVGEDGEEPPTP
jgi:acetyl esterase/lipase